MSRYCKHLEVDRDWKCVECGKVITSKCNHEPLYDPDDEPVFAERDRLSDMMAMRIINTK